MAITEADVQARLRALTDPNTGKDFVAGKAVSKIQIDGADVAVDIELGYPAKTQHEIAEDADRAAPRGAARRRHASAST